MGNAECTGCGCVGFHSFNCPYVGKTAWELQNDPAYKALETELARLKELVREMDEGIRGLYGCLDQHIIEIFNRPEVRAIMGGK